MEYRRDIQGLRAVAVLIVFIFHLNSNWLPGGFIGVDIFFVISGYLISSIILTKMGNNSFSFWEFYKSRVKRIVPAYYVLLFVVLFAGVFLLYAVDSSNLRIASLWAFFFNSNNYYSSLDNYFGTTNQESPLLHTWTLAVEMQFYLFLPILLRWVKRSYIFIIIVLLLLALYVYGTLGVILGNKDLMYFSLPARSPEFLLGVLTSLLVLNKSKILQYTNSTTSILGLVLITISCFFISETSNFPGIITIIPCFGAMLLLISRDNCVTKFLSNRILFFVGELSYSIYLWHWPIMAYFRYYTNSVEFSIVQVALICILTFILALFSFYLFESKIRKCTDKLSLIFFTPIIFGIILLVYYPKQIRIHDYPATYTSPVFGMNSHAKAFVEVMGDSTCKEPKILLLGDSHALNMKKYFDFLGKKHLFSFRTITNNVYPTIPNFPDSIFSDTKYQKTYEEIMKVVPEEIDNAQIIIFQYSMTHGRSARYSRTIRTFIEQLSSDKYFILLCDFPTIEEKNLIKINRGIVKNAKYSYNVLQPDKPEDLIMFINNKANCSFLDFSTSSCFDSAPFFMDTLMYYDGGHLNEFGVINYAKVTENLMMTKLDSIVNLTYKEK